MTEQEEREELLSVLLVTTQEQQEALSKAIKVFETDTAGRAKNVIDEALKPILARLKWIKIIILTAIVIAAVLIFGVFAVIEWKRYELESLTADVAEMEKNVATLEKQKGRIHLEMCGENNNKPCIEVDTKQSFSDTNNRYQFFGLPNAEKNAKK
jgi:hypothetical protein